ncbi:hypothetical protein F2P56_005221 [Juglans regia]|uniref:Membrane-associated kinase regulator 1 n=2 Tax=Juglans regia TaxID=51240 RepID=A0A833Y6T8_JUGRE|nr:hypothetical protein F2P56_005221 [Juglans regia]
MQTKPSKYSMENRRKRSISGERFSFPSTPGAEDQDSDFEFGSVTPDSPSTDPFKNSPADYLFFNGRLLPHAFPIQSAANIIIDSSRTTSRASSISSKDSLRSSRSNSTNSSSSSPRTSASDNSERRLLYQNKVASKASTLVRDHNGYQAGNKALSSQVYVQSSQRWQYITVPVPILTREPSRRKKMEMVGKKLRPKKQAEERKGASLWHFARFFWWIVSACKQCHAMEPSRKDHVLQGNMELDQ